MYGGVAEIGHLPPKAQAITKLSANPFIFAIVAFSRFSLLLKWPFSQLYKLFMRLSLTEEAKQSFRQLVVFATKGLLAAEICVSEATAQCKPLHSLVRTPPL
ncbi:hypothetical protein P171DRAFT_430264 [Karstenula rhodostoma CBS 690.94]|uniref:Uncharacterized protein n=1 Tax=Karstenula rhodostoma CBS 690.94 TaxID=1392251 RepID=A0A9P4PLM1_9PLEO|nr:hypothetical protein P171DRAFT_430264 [Karstenula rhodostoma CBS 690.94]